MAKVSRRHIARQVARRLYEQPEQRGTFIRQLAAYLIETSQTAHAALLCEDIADELFVQHKQLSAEVHHVFELSAGTRAAIADVLKQTTGAVEVELRTKKDPALLGGVIVRTPRYELDASIRRQLRMISRGGTI